MFAKVPLTLRHLTGSSDRSRRPVPDRRRRPPVQNAAALLLGTAFIVAACQSSPDVQSDLRLQPAVGEVTGP